MRIFIVLLLIGLNLGCDKPDPYPEQRDPIYLDLSSQLSETTSLLAEAEKSLAEHEKALSEVSPQTGQNKFAQKRVFEAQNHLVKLKQLKQWLVMATKERKSLSSTNYLKAYKLKQNWPNPAEFEQYKSEMRLRRAKRTWSSKDRIEEYSSQKTKAPAKQGGH